MARFIGLDLSLTHAGVAILRDEAAPELAVIGSAATGVMLKDRYTRLNEHAGRIFEFADPGYLEDGQPEFVDEYIHVVVEQPAYAQTQGSQHDRSGLWWLVMSGFAHYRMTEVPPSVLKKFATGKGNASKAEMMARTAQDFPGLPFKDDNDSDALWLATMAKAHVDPDLSPVPMLAFRTAALKSVAWS